MELIQETQAARQKIIGFNESLLRTHKRFKIVVVVHAQNLYVFIITCIEMVVKRIIGRLSMCFDVTNTFLVGSIMPVWAKYGPTRARIRLSLTICS